MPLNATITKLYTVFCIFISNYMRITLFICNIIRSSRIYRSDKYRNWNLLNFVWSSIAFDASRRHHEFIAKSENKKKKATCLPAEQGMQQLGGQTQQLTTWFSELKTFFGYLSPGLLPLASTWTFEERQKNLSPPPQSRVCNQLDGIKKKERDKYIWEGKQYTENNCSHFYYAESLTDSALNYKACCQTISRRTIRHKRQTENKLRRKC